MATAARNCTGVIADTVALRLGLLLLLRLLLLRRVSRIPRRCGSCLRQAGIARVCGSCLRQSSIALVLLLRLLLWLMRRNRPVLPRTHRCRWLLLLLLLLLLRD